MESVLRIAIQKKGRLHEKSMALLYSCGIKVENGSRALKARASNFPLELLYLRDDDIPPYVEDQVADLGIVGENVLLEHGAEVREVEKLGFAKCRLSLAVPRDVDYPGLHFFQGKRVATSYPTILKNYFEKNGVNASVEEISGSVEIAPGIGLADGICDIVSTGSTLLMNGLKEVEPFMNSQAVLVASPQLSDEKQALLDKLLFRIRAVSNARSHKYILLNTPNDAIPRIKSILPGMKSPTVMPLAEEGWSSLHSVVREDEFWEVIDELREAGAEGILVAPIEKLVL
jgi:ATP phosphoribosyltransferase